MSITEVKMTACFLPEVVGSFIPELDRTRGLMPSFHRETGVKQVI